MKSISVSLKIYLVLITLTLFAFLLGWLELVNTFLISVLLISTFIKAQLVIDYFMDLKEFQWKYRLIPSIWLVMVLLLIAVAYYLPVS